MLLTKLEIKGFKSFGDKILIHFDEGVTGIVGQNGCGKSNVVDAIRWVLGEQKTKALRSDKMENIIFNGTRKRKPLNLAEVSLTFKNTKNIIATEYSEVTITRRLYRSGESEYLLNSVACRLKDITNLFLDTGIGSDSYAIIELKMVDEILNDKDNSRRNLFEEAAGISKFKLRKKETLKKLEDADQDLARVEDLLFELDKQLKTLEKQAKRTEKYFKTKEEYKLASIELAKKSVSDKRELMLQLAKRLSEENDLKLSFQTQLLEREAALEKEKTDIIIQEKTVSSRQKALNEFVNEIRQHESEKKIKNERIKMLHEKKNMLSEQITQDKEREEEAQKQIQVLNQEKISAEKLVQELRAELQGMKIAYETQQQKTLARQNTSKELMQHLQSKQEQSFSLNKNFEIKKSQIVGLEQEIAKSNSESMQRNEALAGYEEQLAESREKLQEFKDEIERLQIDENDLQSRLQDIMDESDTLKEHIIAKNRSLDAKKNEYALTKSLVENMEGFPEAIKFLQQNKHMAENTPFLSDIFTCPDAYKPVVEAFLETMLSYYVLPNTQKALEAIETLHDAQKGKAHFFVLENIENLTLQNIQPIAEAKALRSVIECKAAYAPLFDYLLEGVFVAQEKDIQNLQKKYPHAIFISTNAKILSKALSLSGGSVGVFSGKSIGRAKQLETLEIEIDQLAESIASLKESSQVKQADLQELKNASLKDEIRETQILLNKQNEQFISIRTKTEQLQNFLENSLDNNDTLSERLELLQIEILEIEPQILNLYQELESLREQNEQEAEELAKENDLLSQKSGVYNQQNLKYHQQENRVQSIEQEMKFNEQAMESLKNRLYKNNEDILRATSEIEGLETIADLQDDSLIGMYKEKEAMEKGLNEAEKEYYAARGNIDREEKEIREFQRKKENIDSLIAEVQNKVNDTKLAFTATKERLSVEFNVDLELLMNQENLQISETSEQELRTDVQRLKNILDTIGAINPMAMEAYHEIKERNDFIIAQKEDLVKAKTSLLDTINEIDTVAKENFSKTFESIRQNFQTVFRSLFTEEDTCDLVLLQPNNPLESPIDIIAKPKGKRPLTINQLSGGEKTLTATSLLFAIYLIKPAPFCIFDEVDAPLDDANVDKFTKIIRKFSQQSQFIIVTHNKRTMAATDVMYGVTMFPEDPGVSKLVPVDMRDLQEEFVSN